MLPIRAPTAAAVIDLHQGQFPERYLYRGLQGCLNVELFRSRVQGHRMLDEEIVAGKILYLKRLPHQDVP